MRNGLYEAERPLGSGDFLRRQPPRAPVGGFRLWSRRLASFKWCLIGFHY